MKKSGRNQSASKGANQTSADYSSRRSQSNQTSGRSGRNSQRQDRDNDANQYRSDLNMSSTGEGQYETGARRYEYDKRDYGRDQDSHRGLASSGTENRSGRYYGSDRDDTTERDYRNDYRNQQFGGGFSSDQSWMDRSSTGSHMSGDIGDNTRWARGQNDDYNLRGSSFGSNDDYNRSYSSRGMYGNQGLYNPSTSSLSRQRDTQRVWDSNRNYENEDRNFFERAGHWLSEQAGKFVGKGPKGYRRSDERIHEDVCEALARHPHIDASEIEINVKEGEVILTGTVDSRQAKRMAEDAVERCSGVKDVQNQIRVQTSTLGTDTSTQTKSARNGANTSNTTGSSTRRTS